MLKHEENRRQNAGAIILVFMLFAQVITAIPQLSITFDEDVHITTGYSILRTGDFRLVEDHPPLIELWMSWPLLLSPEVPHPEEVPTWNLGDRRLFARNDAWWQVPLDLWTMPCRIPIAWLAVILAVFLYRWASDWFGHTAGLVILGLFVFDPNILAHGSLATLDLGVTTLMFITLYCVQRFLRTQKISLVAAAGVILGLAMGAKVSAFILLPISTGLILLWGIWHRQRKVITWLFVYLSLAFLVLWATYRFDFGIPSDTPIANIHIPVPAPDYWRAFLRVSDHVSVGDRTYLLGETYQGGRWYFFPIVFALKTPLPTLILLGIALIGGIRDLYKSIPTLFVNSARTADILSARTADILSARTADILSARTADILSARTADILLRAARQRVWHELTIIGLPLSYLAISILSAINLGYRHLLPILPFMYLFLARLFSQAPKPTRRGPRKLRYTGIILLLFWQAMTTLHVWPHHLTYFNEIAGGPENGYRYLADSNVDWGQGLKALRAYLDDHSELGEINLSTFAYFIRPELYGIRATPLPPLADGPAVLPARFNPAPGTYIISASTLRGLQTVDSEMYNWFWHREPDALVANAMLVYHVTEPNPEPDWLAQCTAPVAPLSEQAMMAGFGWRDLHSVGIRTLFFDCTQSWITPEGGQSTGWYVLHRDAAQMENAFIQRALSDMQLSFEQKIPQTTPALTIYIRPSREQTLAVEKQTLWTSMADWPPTQVTSEGKQVSSPIPFAEGLSFIEYEVTQTDEALTVISYWEVKNVPERLFSLMAHLLGDSAAALAVGDGFGIPLDQLRPGDILAQRHTFSLPPDNTTTPQWLRLGVYWLENGERWPVAQPHPADAIFIPLDGADK